jgi:hypothetical protein
MLTLCRRWIGPADLGLSAPGLVTDGALEERGSDVLLASDDADAGAARGHARAVHKART